MGRGGERRRKGRFLSTGGKVGYGDEEGEEKGGAERKRSGCAREAERRQIEGGRARERERESRNKTNFGWYEYLLISWPGGSNDLDKADAVYIHR